MGVAESRSLSGSHLEPQSGEKGENRESNQITSVLIHIGNLLCSLNKNQWPHETIRRASSADGRASLLEA